MTKLGSSHGDKDYQIIDQKTAYQGYFRIAKYRYRHRLFCGEWSTELEREIFLRGDSVAVLLHDPALDKLVMIEQFRAGALGRKPNPWLIEIVAGMIEPGQSPETVARKETFDEAGVQIDKLTPICDFLVSAGGSSERMYLYYATVDASDAGGIHGLAEEHEDIRVMAVDTKEVFTALAKGDIDNAMTIIALQWLQFRELKRAD